MSTDQEVKPQTVAPVTPPSDAPIKFETDDSGRIQATFNTEKPPVHMPSPPTARQQSQTDMEMEAGRRRVAMAAEQLANRPPVVLSEAEKKAMGTNTPVYRPGNFEEYKPLTTPATSKG